MFLKSFKCPQVLAMLLTSHFLLLRSTIQMPLSKSVMDMNHTVNNSRYKPLITHA